MTQDNKTTSLISGKLKVYLYSTTALALVCAILRAVCYFVSFDASIGYFNDTPLVAITNILFVLTLLWATSGFLLIPKKAMQSARFDFGGNAVFFTSLIAGFVMAADFVYKIYAYNKNGVFKRFEFVFSDSYRSDSLQIERVTMVLVIVGIVSSLLSSICFFARSSLKSKKALTAGLGIFPMLRLLSGTALVYFEMNVQMNSPSKLMIQFAMISLMLYFLGEERQYISNEYERPGRYFVFGLIAFVLSISTGVSELIAYYSGLLTRGDFCVEAFICFILSFYVLSRILVLASPLEPAAQTDAVEGSAPSNEPESPTAETEPIAERKEEERAADGGEETGNE